MSKSSLITVLVLLCVFLASTMLPLIPIVRAQRDDYWISRAPLNHNVSFPTVIAVNNKIYAISPSVMEEYNPETNTWVSKTPIPTERSDFAVAVYKNKIYVIGGHTSFLRSDHIIIGVNEAYDPKTDTWETKKEMPTPRYYIEGNTVGNKIYIIAGKNNAGPDPSTISTVNEVYYPETDTWTTKSPMPIPKYAYASTVLDSKIYFFAGGFSESNTNQIYDTITDTWIEGMRLPTFCRSISAVTTTGIWAPKRIYVLGGSEGFAVPLNLNRVYDPLADEWSVGAPMLTSRYAVSVAVIDDFLYAIGGGSGLSGIKANELYIPAGHTLADTILTPTPTPTPSITPNPTPTIEPTSTPTSSPEPSDIEFPVLIVASIIIIVVCSIGIFVFFKKNKGKTLG